ncbi:MAG: hypothetical protein ACRCWM_07595 [Sarcina sp.]
MSKKRMSLYFNLDVSSDKQIWDYLESNGRKSELIKRLILNDMNEVVTVPKQVEVVEVENKNTITPDEYDEIMDELI